MEWGKKKLVHDEIFYYDVEPLSHNINEIMKEKQVNPEIAIYCFFKHYVLQKFKGRISFQMDCLSMITIFKTP